MFKLIWNRIYGSTPATFESAYDLEESVRRLKAATVSSIWPSLIIKEVMYGSVSAKSVSLCHLSSPGGYFDDSFSSSMVGKSSYESRFQNLATSSQTRNYNITIIPIIVNLWGIYERIMEIRHF